MTELAALISHRRFLAVIASFAGEIGGNILVTGQAETVLRLLVQRRVALAALALEMCVLGHDFTRYDERLGP